MIFDDLRQLAEAASAGFFGALVSLPLNPDTRGWSDRCILVGSGAVTAYYVGPFVVGFFHINPSLGSSVSFLVGAFGMSLSGTIMRGIRNADLWALIRERIGSKP